MKYRSLLRWVSGRGPFVDDGFEVFTAEHGTLTTPVAFGIAGVIEIVAVHFLVPWPWLQWTLLAVSVWGLLAVAGVLAHHRMHPHATNATTLTLKTAGQTVADIPRATVVGAAVHRRYGVVAAAIDRGRLFLPTQDGTNVDIELSHPVDVAVPAPLAKWRMQGSVRRLSVQVDDPMALVRALTRAAPHRSHRVGCDE
ncbi:hypothetical protein A2J03_13380 [Rhodococcus sp. EPR-157]|uniref:hypothetical protein n=1 Tax=Rhodococcus sp. EPR-157 TaxID=1813677 RepID=UPI0007BB5882|nr:hypothetical protein [Rhodococcus sp. EPR-157]KZE98613.1 hypothetical protein A2J03_13380 [Rhodococcus sp. EPR-157]